MAKEKKVVPKKKSNSTSSAVPERLKPDFKTLRSLYIRSGNLCAYPKCEIVMLNKEGTMIGEVCHIEAVSRTGPRHRKGMSDNELRSGENLILMCRNHHKKVDGNPAKYTVKRLRAIKAAHEDKFSEVSDTLRRTLSGEFKDETQSVLVNNASTLKRYKKIADSDLTPGDIENCLKQLASFSKKLQVTPIPVRRFVVAIIERAIRLDRKTHQIIVPASDVRGALKLSDYKINSLGGDLKNYRLGDVDQYGENEVWSVHIKDIGNDMPLATLAKYCHETGIPLSDIIVDLKFHLLD
jgi:hypothetical protein